MNSHVKLMHLQYLGSSSSNHDGGIIEEEEDLSLETRKSTITNVIKTKKDDDDTHSMSSSSSSSSSSQNTEDAVSLLLCDSPLQSQQLVQQRVQHRHVHFDLHANQVGESATPCQWNLSREEKETLWYSATELRQQQEQLVPQALEFFQSHPQRAARGVRALRGSYRHLPTPGQHPLSSTSTTQLNNNNSSSSSNNNHVDTLVLRRRLSDYLYSDPFSDSNSINNNNTILGLERIIMGVEYTEAAKQDRRQFLSGRCLGHVDHNTTSQSSSWRRYLWGFDDSNNQPLPKEVGTPAAAADQDVPSTSPASRASSHLAHEMAQALAMSLSLVVV
ncbi:hypothetical protein ACA910_016710 [Epithemia clementina (nom. ined.)]